MSDIKSLHKTARTLILNLREGLEQLERSENVRVLFVSVQVCKVYNKVRCSWLGTPLWRGYRVIAPVAAQAVRPAKD